jgi:hypothetical protein
MHRFEQQELHMLARPMFTITPNPASGDIAIHYAVPARTPACIELYDATGRLVMNLFNGTLNGAGILNAQPTTIASGIYFIKATMAQETVIRKFIYMR